MASLTRTPMSTTRVPVIGRSRSPRLRTTAEPEAVALAGGCASGPDVRGDYDRSVDFGKYKTYNFLSAASGNPAEFQSISQQILQQAASREMEARGYKNVYDALATQTQNTGMTQGEDYGNTWQPAASALRAFSRAPRSQA